MKYLLLPVLALWVSGCGTRGPKEPEGIAVELAPDEINHATYEDVRMWVSWHLKGLRLISTRDGNVPAEEDYQKALYCFHQALTAWPKKLPDNAEEARKQRHQEVPADTLLQLGWLYLKMKRPELAKYYFQRFDSYRPGTPFAAKGIADADAMLKQNS